MDKPREKLRRKIINEYGSISNFCEQTGFSRGTLSYLINGHKDGSMKTWKEIQKGLKIKDSELWTYQITEE